MRLDDSSNAVTDRKYYEMFPRSHDRLGHTNLLETTYLYKRTFSLNGAEEYTPTRKYYEKVIISKSMLSEDNDVIIEAYDSLSYTKVDASKTLDPHTTYYTELNGYYIEKGTGATIALNEGNLWEQTYNIIKDTESENVIAYKVYRPIANEKVDTAQLYYLYYETYKVVKDELDDYSDCYFLQYNNLEEGEDYKASTCYYLYVPFKEVEIRWYRYELGASAADEYCGVYWTRIDNDDSEKSTTYLINDYTLSFMPDSTYNEKE